MWDIITALPLAAQITLPILAVILLIGVAYLGRVSIQWGGPSIKFGRRSKRSCKDCMVLTFSKREEFEVKHHRLENSILKNQMNFAEHKLDSVLFSLSQDYRDHLKEKRTPTSEPDLEKEHHDYLLYEEILKQALAIAKDELRRSFKENGFHELGGVEFQSYVKNKAADLINMTRSYLIHRYPTTGMLISIDERVERLNIGKMEDICFDVYVNAKEVRNRIEAEINTLEQDFINKIQEMLKAQGETDATI